MLSASYENLTTKMICNKLRLLSLPPDGEGLFVYQPGVVRKVPARSVVIPGCRLYNELKGFTNPLRAMYPGIERRSNLGGQSATPGVFVVCGWFQTEPVQMAKQYGYLL